MRSSAFLVGFLSVIISAAHFNVAQAQEGRACAQELQKHCIGVMVFGNNLLGCLQKEQDKLSKRCAALAHNIVRRCDRDAVQRCQYVVAGQGNILGCLTAARSSVSAECNAALDAGHLRW
jgi:hypothetical protein